MSNPISSYGKVFHTHHREAQALLGAHVVIQEKVDGSQFSFGLKDGEPVMRSRGKQIFSAEVDKLFCPAAETVMRLADEGKLPEGWVFRGEAFMGPRHNTLHYGRAPEGGIILYDACTETTDDWLTEAQLLHIAEGMGLEKVPCYFEGVITDLSMAREYLTRTSVLGKQIVEGVVIKARSKYDTMGKMLRCKLVREDFQEQNNKAFRKSNPTQGDIVLRLSEKYSAIARYHKAYQHLREEGYIEDELKDLQHILPEIGRDLEAECIEDIKEELWKWAAPKIKRNITRQVPNWYKEFLAEKAGS